MNFQNTIAANAPFLNGSVYPPPPPGLTAVSGAPAALDVNRLIQACYGCMTQVDALRGRLSSDQYNYLQEHFNQIIMILSNVATTTTIGRASGGTVTDPVPFSLFDHPYRREDLDNLPPPAALASAVPTGEAAARANSTLSVPEEYKILTSLDRQLAYTKYGERVVVPATPPPAGQVGQPDQVIVGNGFDIGRHVTPMAQNKYR